MIVKHSESAKKGTSKQIDGIIDLLEKQIYGYETDYKKYTKKVYERMKMDLKSNIYIARKSLQYYQKLKNNYIKDNLV